MKFKMNLDQWFELWERKKGNKNSEGELGVVALKIFN